MKKITITIIILVISIISTAFAQQQGIKGFNNWLDNWTEFTPKSIDYNEPNQMLFGDITEDTKLYKRNTYLLSGNVFITNNAVLTIEPGTVIMGDSESKATLTISKGAKIVAEGTLTDPIVFTSNKSFKKAGDWGGIIILGDAPTNKLGNSSSVSKSYPKIQQFNYLKTNFGGDNIESSSGVLDFVRIEYAGRKLNNEKDSNALILAGIGSKTKINNVMISYSDGNAFNIMGGKVDLNQLVSYKSRGNDYVFNHGAQSNIGNSLAIRSPYLSSDNGSRSMKIVSYDEIEEVDFSKNETKVIAQNITLLTDSENIETNIESGLIKEAIYIGRKATFKIDKSVVSGFSPAILFDKKIAKETENLHKIKFSNIYFNNCNGNIFADDYMVENEILKNRYSNPSYFNIYAKSPNSETFIDMKNKRPDYRLHDDGMAMGK